MTINDLCPGMDQLPLDQQLRQVVIRARACQANIEIIPDPRLLEKMLCYLELAVQIGSEMAGVGGTDNAPRAYPGAPAPAPPPGEAA